MKKLALLLCMALIFGILGTGAFAKKDGNDAGRGKGYGRGGKYGQTESEGDGKPETLEEGEDEDDGDDGEGEETGDTEDTEETDDEDDDGGGNGNAKGLDNDTPKAPADYNGLNKPGKTKHLYLYEKEPTGDWLTVEGGAWGKMVYTPVGKTFRFNFEGHGLEPGTDYTLLYYPDPWPGTGLVCLGTGTANQGGQIHISERVNTNDIPTEDDANEEGGKIWLVLSSDVDCEGAQMIGWNPTEYLFEYNLITFDNTDYTAPTEETEESEETEE